MSGGPLAAARLYIDRDWRVFACDGDKRPLVRDGFYAT